MNKNMSSNTDLKFLHPHPRNIFGSWSLTGQRGLIIEMGRDSSDLQCPVPLRPEKLCESGSRGQEVQC